MFLFSSSDSRPNSQLLREAVFLADRVLVLSPRPATIFQEFTIDLPRPRPKRIEYSEDFGRLAYQIRQAIEDLPADSSLEILEEKP